jgi:4-carboxymuconolactone decarboxylase
MPAAASDDGPAFALLWSRLLDWAMPEFSTGESAAVHPVELDDKSRAMVVLAALIATGGGSSSYRRCVDAAIAAGTSAEEVVDLLVAVAPTVGLALLAPATNELAAALGYDIDRALEAPDVPTRPPA